MYDSQVSAEKKIIAEYVHQIILAWLEDKLNEIEYLIDNEIMMCIPVESKQYIGKKQFIEYLQKFLINKKVDRYNEEDFSIHINDLIATVHYNFVMEYEQNNKSITETGRDFFIFKKDQDKWKLVWRSLYNFN